MDTTGAVARYTVGLMSGDLSSKQNKSLIRLWWDLNRDNPVAGIIVAVIVGCALLWPLIDPGFYEANGYFGALAGSFMGLLAILLGALYNAELTRQRDERIRRENIHSSLAGLLIEMHIVLVRLRAAIASMEQEDYEKDCRSVISTLESITFSTELVNSESVLLSLGAAADTKVYDSYVSYVQTANHLSRIVLGTLDSLREMHDVLGKPFTPFVTLLRNLKGQEERMTKIYSEFNALLEKSLNQSSSKQT